MIDEMQEEKEMRVKKRDGTFQNIAFDKILNRVKNLGKMASITSINYSSLIIKVIDQLYDGISTTKIDELTAEQCATLSTLHPDYITLASYITVSNNHKNTVDSFFEVMKTLYENKNGNFVHSPLVSHELMKHVSQYKDAFESMIQYKRDYLIEYFGFKTLEYSYLMKINGKNIERPQHMWLRVAIGIHGDDLKRVKETYDLMSQKYFTHATPTLFNAGTLRPQLSSCYLIAMEEDSLTGIFNTLGDCAHISKWAGGIGLHIHNIRAKGSLIAGTNGSSTGIVPMLRVFNSTARYVDQGGRRNGSFAIYLEPWHADICDFLELKKNHGDEELKARDLFYALWIPDLFMRKVKANEDWCLFSPSECPGLSDTCGNDFDSLYRHYESEKREKGKINARDLWFKIMDSQMETGTPYLLYKDACNKKSNQQNLGVIKSSNLCVSPETFILTDKGCFQIRELEGQCVNVWNGEKWSNTTILKTGQAQKLVTVHLSNGAQITCTPYHKFIIRKDYYDKLPLKHATRVEASKLKKGMKLTKFNLQLLQGNSSEDISYPYTHGFFCGDGTYHKNPSGYIGKGLSLYCKKKDLIPFLNIKSSSFKEDASGRINLMLPDELPEKYYVPINSSLQCRLSWLAGLLDSDGSVCINGSNESLQIGSIHFEFLDRVRLMLLTLGISSKVTLSRHEGVTLLPDGKGGRKEYACKPLWRLLISSSSLYILKLIGLTCHRVKITGSLPQRNAEQFISVVSVVDNGRIDDTYCFNEPENHAGVFNGVLTGNCTEIVQYSDHTETAVCNLASIALNKFVKPEGEGADSNGPCYDFETLHAVTKIVTYNLNRIIDINYYPTEKTKKSNMRHRPIGIGVQGLADVFMMMNYAFASSEAKELNKQIFETMYHAALESSLELSKLNGPYETFQGSPASKGVLQFDMWEHDPGNSRYDWTALKASIVEHGLRNSLLLAPMPTASTSQILGNNEAFEPITSNIYTRRTMAGEFIVMNKYLMRELIHMGLWNERLKNNIIANRGSIQHLTHLSDHIRNKYKTVWEIPMKDVIDMSADRAVFICQSQSLNLWMEEPNYKSLTSMHFYAWQKGLKTGLYYLRRKPKHQAQQFTIEPPTRAMSTNDVENEDENNDDDGLQFYQDDDEENTCTMCSS
jgi:ribonucleoside-diphosphate reductase alpha chain